MMYAYLIGTPKEMLSLTSTMPCLTLIAWLK